MSTLKIPFLNIEDQTDFPKFDFWPGAMFNPQWLELPMSRMNFHGPKDFRAIEVLLWNESIHIVHVIHKSAEHSVNLHHS